jgi:hypothetical protein
MCWKNVKQAVKLSKSSAISQFDGFIAYFYHSLNGFNVDSHRFMGSFLLIAQWISMA